MKFARLLLGVVFVLGVAPRAYGHAAYADSDPKSGADLKKPPSSVRVEYTEPPTGEAVFNVSDGCGNDVVDAVRIQNLAIDASLIEGQPGKWRVEWRVISGLDGHATNDGFSFKVAGQRDCSALPSPSPRSTEGEDSGSGSGFLIPLVIGTVVLIALALLVRSRAS